MDFPALVAKELTSSRIKHGPMTTHHEALAVLWEEFEEVKEEVFLKVPHPPTLLAELVQVGAMAQRFAEDILDKE